MVVCIVQARMTSTRFPGKVMVKVKERPLIDYLLERLSFSEKMDKIIIAVPNTPKNKILGEYLLSQKQTVFYGSETDVLDRYYQAAKSCTASIIVRITGDCPLIDWTVIDTLIETFQRNTYDYMSNVLSRTYPVGLDAEVFSYSALEQAWREATLPYDREHVTPYLRQSGKFSIGSLTLDKNYSHLRWTLDYKSDLPVIKKVLEHFHPSQPRFTMNDVLTWMPHAHSL